MVCCGDVDAEFVNLESEHFRGANAESRHTTGEDGIFRQGRADAALLELNPGPR